MDEQTFVPPTMRALYYTPIATPTTTTTDITAVDGTPTKKPNSGLVFDTDFPVPKPSPTQYLLKVQTTAFSHDELRLANILNPRQSMPQIPLHNVCGTVIITPSADHWNPSGPRFKVDDVVFGLVSYTRDGAAADYVLATEEELAFKPRNVSAAEAATIPLPALTAWQALFTYGGLGPGENQTATTNHRKTSSHGSRNSNNSSKANGIGKHNQLRILITNARDSEVGMQALQLLRSQSLFQQQQRPWVCATCSNPDQEKYLRADPHVDETIPAPLPLAPEFDISTPFLTNNWAPVDLVLDCAGGQMFRQAHSPSVVKDKGVVLTAVDSGPAQSAQHQEPGVAGAEITKRELFSRFIAMEPDGETLGRIARMVEEEGSVRGRVESIVDLVNGADILDAGAAGANGARRGGMIVVRVN